MRTFTKLPYVDFLPLNDMPHQRNDSKKFQSSEDGGNFAQPRLPFQMKQGHDVVEGNRSEQIDDEPSPHVSGSQVHSIQVDVIRRYDACSD